MNKQTIQKIKFMSKLFKMSKNKTDRISNKVQKNKVKSVICDKIFTNYLFFFFGLTSNY